jgi:hypothetical protein
MLECKYFLQRWIERNNALKKHYSSILSQCATFEYQLVSKLKATCRTHVALVQKQYQMVNDVFIEMDGIYFLNVTNSTGSFAGVEQGTDWQYFASVEPSLITVNRDSNVKDIQFENCEHDLTTPLLMGNLDVLNRISRRYEQGFFCLTKSGFLMRFEKGYEELRKYNVEPSLSLNLTRSMLGPLKRGRNSASFTLTAEKFVHQGGRHWIIHAPLKFAIHTMSTLTKVKIKVTIEDAEAWYDHIAGFARMAPRKEDQEEDGGKKADEDFTSSPKSRAVSSISADPFAEGQDDDDTHFRTSRRSSGRTDYRDEQEGEDHWDDSIYQCEEPEQKSTPIVGHQPPQVTENPW